MNNNQNNINNGSSSNNISNNNAVIDEDVQRSIDNNADMLRSNQMVLAQYMAQRPKNTTKAYAAKQADWKVSNLIYYCKQKINLICFCITIGMVSSKKVYRWRTC